MPTRRAAPSSWILSLAAGRRLRRRRGSRPAATQLNPAALARADETARTAAILHAELPGIVGESAEQRFGEPSDLLETGLVGIRRNCAAGAARDLPAALAVPSDRRRKRLDDDTVPKIWTRLDQLAAFADLVSLVTSACRFLKKIGASLPGARGRWAQWRRRSPRGRGRRCSGAIRRGRARAASAARCPKKFRPVAKESRSARVQTT